MQKNRSVNWMTGSKNHLIKTSKIKNKLKNEDSLRDLWEINSANIHIEGVLEEEKKKGRENVFEEIMAENFLNLAKERDIPVQEAESPKQVKPKETHTKTHYN